MIKVDWLATCIALKVGGAVLVVFLRRWRKICTILQPIGSKGLHLKKCPKLCGPVKSKETWTKYTPRQTGINREKYTFLRYEERVRQEWDEEKKRAKERSRKWEDQ